MQTYLSTWFPEDAHIDMTTTTPPPPLTTDTSATTATTTTLLPMPTGSMAPPVPDMLAHQTIALGPRGRYNLGGPQAEG